MTVLVNRFILQVLQQLPAKHDHVIKVDLIEDQRQLYDDSFVNCSKQFKQSGKMADTIFRGAQVRYFELFWPRTKLRLN